MQESRIIHVFFDDLLLQLSDVVALLTLGWVLDHVDDLVAAVGFDRRRRVFASLKLKGCLLVS